jgi:hypothetical protein
MWGLTRRAPAMGRLCVTLYVIPAPVLGYVPTIGNPSVGPFGSELAGLLIVNLLVIIPLESMGLHLVAPRVVGYRPRLARILRIVTVANLVTAFLGYPFAVAAFLAPHPIVWLLLLHALGSMIEGAVYYAHLRTHPTTFEQSFGLALAANALTYSPTLIVTAAMR